MMVRFVQCLINWCLNITSWYSVDLLFWYGNTLWNAQQIHKIELFFKSCIFCAKAYLGVHIWYLIEISRVDKSKLIRSEAALWCKKVSKFDALMHLQAFEVVWWEKSKKKKQAALRKVLLFGKSFTAPFKWYFNSWKIPGRPL